MKHHTLGEMHPAPDAPLSRALAIIEEVAGANDVMGEREAAGALRAVAAPFQPTEPANPNERTRIELPYYGTMNRALRPAR